MEPEPPRRGLERTQRIHAVSEIVLETCQRCGHKVPTNPLKGKGRLEDHLPDGQLSSASLEGVGFADAWRPLCEGSGHPSIEEIARRKARRAAHKDALLAELLPEAPAALDAFLNGREEYRRRLADFRLVALYKFRQGQAQNTAIKHPVELNLDAYWHCVFCKARLARVALHDTDWWIASQHEPHVTQCSLEFLAGLRRAIGAST